MHTIYEVVEASVKQSAPSDNKTLRIKLTVTPLTSCRNRRGRFFLMFIKNIFFIFTLQSIDEVVLYSSFRTGYWASREQTGPPGGEPPDSHQVSSLFKV